jgi:hypothetical protein
MSRPSPEGVRLARAVLDSYNNPDGEDPYDQSGTQDAPRDTASADHAAVEERMIAASLAARSRVEKTADILAEVDRFIEVYKAEGGNEMKDTKEDVWTLLQQRASESAPKDGLESTEQGIARLLGTPEGATLYEKWKSAAWRSDNPANPCQAASATIHKSELEPSAIRQAVNKAEAERAEELRMMGEEAASATH